MPAFASPLINDERDRPFVRLMLRGGGWVIPAAIALFIPGVFRWWLGAIYLAVTMGVFFPPFTLMLHCTSHRPLFTKRYEWMNRIIPLVLSPFFGQSPGTYAAHHIGMHHPENNLWEDDSSTLPYQRDSILDFGHYFFRFLFIGIAELTRYLWRHKRTKLGRRALAGELGFWTGAVLLATWNLGAALTVFVIPALLARFLMMAGNWAQHAFVDCAAPANAYRNSITCTEVAYNDRCFNDGYHIGHHLQARMHWTEMREEFERNKARYRDEGAIVFRGVDYFVIWFLLMIHAYRTLARHVVQLAEPPRTEDELVAMFKERLRPIPEQHAGNAAPIAG